MSKIILNKHINIVHVRSRFPAWSLQFIRNKKFKTVSTFHNVYGSQNVFKKILGPRVLSSDDAYRTYSEKKMQNLYVCYYNFNLIRENRIDED